MDGKRIEHGAVESNFKWQKIAIKLVPHFSGMNKLKVLEHAECYSSLKTPHEPTNVVWPYHAGQGKLDLLDAGHGHNKKVSGAI